MLEFMIELKKTTHRDALRRVPSDWDRVSATKQVPARNNSIHAGVLWLLIPSLDPVRVLLSGGSFPYTNNSACCPAIRAREGKNSYSYSEGMGISFETICFWVQSASHRGTTCSDNAWFNGGSKSCSALKFIFMRSLRTTVLPYRLCNWLALSTHCNRSRKLQGCRTTHGHDLSMLTRQGEPD